MNQFANNLSYSVMSTKKARTLNNLRLATQILTPKTRNV